MRNGDLDNTPLPRMAVVFEGAVGFLENEDRPSFNQLMRKRHYRHAVDLWEMNDFLIRIIWDRVWRSDATIDIVTFLGPDEFAEALSDRLGDEEVPVNQVWATTPKLLARKMPMMPDLVRVYFPDPALSLYFGSKGRLLTDANDLGRI